MKLFVHSREEGTDERNPWALLRGQMHRADRAMWSLATAVVVLANALMWLIDPRTITPGTWVVVVTVFLGFRAMIRALAMMDAVLSSPLMLDSQTTPQRCEDLTAALERRSREVVEYTAVMLGVTFACMMLRLWVLFGETTYQLNLGHWNVLGSVPYTPEAISTARVFFPAAFAFHLSLMLQAVAVIYALMGMYVCNCLWVETQVGERGNVGLFIAIFGLVNLWVGIVGLLILFAVWLEEISPVIGIMQAPRWWVSWLETAGGTVFWSVIFLILLAPMWLGGRKVWKRASGFDIDLVREGIRIQKRLKMKDD